MTEIDLQRKTVVFPDGEEGRIYYDGAGNVFPSVTTVLSRREDPGKARAIAAWQDRHDGEGAAADHEHLFSYSGWRGTLIHWYCLSELDPSLGLGGNAEEQEAVASIEAHDTDYEWVYSTCKLRAEKMGVPVSTLIDEKEDYDPTEGRTLTSLTWRDASWALQSLTEFFPEMGLAAQSFTESDCKTIQTYFSRDVRQSQVRDTERFVCQRDPPYAGQFDLLYEDDEGRTVLCDLKTSSALRWKHKRQLAAYAHACEEEIDELCLIRLYPDGREASISWESDWQCTRAECFSDFSDLCERVQQQIEYMNAETDPYDFSFSQEASG